MSGFVQRQIDISVALGLGKLGADGTRTLTFQGPRVSVQIERAGLPGWNTCNITLFGLSLANINEISSLGKPFLYDRNNFVTVFAGQAGQTLPIAFTGLIQEAWGDFNAAPDVAFTIQARAGLIDATKPVPTSSFNGPADAALIISGLATLMGYAFENNGVTAYLSYPYFHGTARQQLEDCVAAADIYAYIDDGTRSIAIWPKNANRSTAVIPLISPLTGLVGYPSFSAGGLAFRCLYNPNLQLGKLVQIQSSLTPACGTWTIYRLTHNLDCQVPGGSWFSSVEAYRLGDPAVIPS